MRIVVVAEDTQGPTQFMAYRNDGSILTFGGGTNGTLESSTAQYAFVNAGVPSCSATGCNQCATQPLSCTQETQKPARLAWGLTSVADRNGNTMAVSWSLSVPSAAAGLPGAGLEWTPVEMAYGANLLSGLSNTRLVQLQYVQPSLTGADYLERHYIAGVPVDTRVLLSAIYLVAPNPVNQGVVKSYQFQYNWFTSPASTAAQTRIPVLYQISECDSHSVCKPSVELDYYADPLSFEATDMPPSWTDLPITPISDIVTLQRTGTWPARIYTPDLNNDGMRDLLYLGFSTSSDKYSFNTRFSTGSDYSSAVPTTQRSNLPTRMFPFDFNGDGMEDVLVVQDAPIQPPLPEVDVWDNIYTQYDRAHVVEGASIGEIADLNGDGLGDVVYAVQNMDVVNGSTVLHDWHYQLNALNGFGPDTSFSVFTLGLDDHRFVDVDGDGALEILTDALAAGDPANQGRYNAYRAGTGQNSAPATTLSNHACPVSADSRRGSIG